MPCTAKKAEAVRPNSFTDGEQDTDIVITTTELLRMIDNFGLDFATLDPEACDMPFGFGSGGGVGLQNAVGQGGQNGIPHLQLDQLILQRVAVGQNVQPHRVGADAVGYLAAVGGESCK